MAKLLRSVFLTLFVTIFATSIWSLPLISFAEASPDLPNLGAAPQFKSAGQWFNATTPLSMEQLQGRVVLIDFWTYSCVNCVRTLPHITSWYEKYKDKNFTVIGVHTPEFDFEKDPQNVENALNQFQIHYPVVTDNDFQIWNAFKNQYWPAKYLIDAKGQIRRTHFGEGQYDEMESAIRQLLEEAGNTLEAQVSGLKDTTPRYPRTEETYLGKDRMERFASKEQVRGGEQTFSLPASIPQDFFAYEGVWNVSGESAKAQMGSALEFHFQAGQVFLVIAPEKKGNQIKVLLDGKIIDDSLAGADVKSGMVNLDQQRLYHLIDLKGKIESHLLRLEFLNKGILVYAFTFG